MEHGTTTKYEVHEEFRKGMVLKEICIGIMVVNISYENYIMLWSL